MKSMGPLFLLVAAVGLAAAGALHGASFNVPAPASLSVTSTPSGARITYRGATNFQFQIQLSSNWVGWSLLASNVATNQAITFVDTQAVSRPARFYKAVSLKTPLLYQGNFRNGEIGNFLVFVRTNNQATFIGFNSTRRRGEFASPLGITEDGKGCGTFITGAPGCLLLTTNAVSGNFTNAASQVGFITGVQKANTGIFNGAAGMYSGTISGSVSGSAKILLSPDGTFAFYLSIPSAAQTDGQIYTMQISGIVNFVLQNGDHVIGSFNRPGRTFSLTVHNSDQTVLIGTINMPISEPLF